VQTLPADVALVQGTDSFADEPAIDSGMQRIGIEGMSVPV